MSLYNLIEKIIYVSSLRAQVSINHTNMVCFLFTAINVQRQKRLKTMDIFEMRFMICLHYDEKPILVLIYDKIYFYYNSVYSIKLTLKTQYNKNDWNQYTINNVISYY